MATIQIPVLFDMSGDTVIFGEEATGDFVGSHLDFILDMTTEANDISLNAADISAAILVGDQDTGDNIFYSGGSSGNIAVDNLCNRIAKAITRGKLVHIPKTGNSSNSGIPMGGRLYVVRADGQQELPPDGQYAEKYPHSIAPIGDEQMLGEAMARVTSVHLMGTPLPASILVNKNSVQSDLETTTGQTFNDGNTAFYNALAVQLSKVLGGSKSSAPMNNGSAVSQEPIVGTLVKDLFVHAGSDNAAASEIWKTTVMLQNDGTNIISLSRTLNIDVLKIHKDTGAVTNLGESDGPGSSYVNGNNFVYHDNHIYYIFEGKFGTPSNGSMYHLQKMNVNTGTITYDVVDLTDGVTETTGIGYSLSKDTSGNLWAFGKYIYKIPFATMTKQTMRSVEGGNAGGVYNKDIVYHAEKDLFYIAGNSMGSRLQTYDPNTPGTAPVNVAGNNQSPVGDETDNGIGMNARLNMDQIVLGSNGQYLYITSRDEDDKRIRAIRLSDYAISTHLTIEDYRGGITRIGNKLYYSLSKSGDNLFKLKSVPEINASGTVTYPLDADGTSVPALKSIFEQLMNVPGRSQIMDTRDVSNSNTTITGGFPFISGDKLVMYLRPKIVFAAQTQAENNNALFTFNYTGKKVVGVPVYNIADKNGDITGQTYTHSSSQNNTGFIFEKATTGAGITGANFWSSAGNTYAATTGLHEGSNANGTTTNVDVGVTPPTTTTTHIVTVGDNGGNKFKIDGAFNPTLTFVKGNTYIFDQSDATNSGHQIQISETPDGGNTSYVTATGTPGSAGAKTTVVVPTNASATLYYNCNPHGSGMGNSINVTNPPNSISGEWGQVDIGQSTWATELNLTTNNSYNERMPVEFRLLGSIDGTNWKTLIHETEAAPWVDNTPVTFTIPNPEPLRYYRYVVIKTHGDAELRTSLGHLDLRGVKYPSEITEVSDPGLMSGTTLDISGLQTNVVASSANINDAFPGNATNGPEAEPSKWGWMGSANSDSLSLDTTDVTDPRTIDLHIWKITITL